MTLAACGMRAPAQMANVREGQWTGANTMAGPWRVERIPVTWRRAASLLYSPPLQPVSRLHSTLEQHQITPFLSD